MLQFISSGQFISDYRIYLLEHGISNAHVARMMGISPQQLQNVFKKKELTVSDVQLLCAAINYKCELNIRERIKGKDFIVEVTSDEE